MVADHNMTLSIWKTTGPDSIGMEDDSIDTEDDKIDMEEDSVDMGFLSLWAPGGGGTRRGEIGRKGRWRRARGTQALQRGSLYQ